MNMPNSLSVKGICLNAALCLGIVAFQSGCVSNSVPVCRQTVAEPGVYQVTYTDSNGALHVEYLSADSSGTIQVGSCTSLVGDPELLLPNSPPDCSQARPSLPKLVASSQDFVDVSIEGVTDPDGDLVIIQIDSILQNEPTGGLYEGDRSPDAEITFDPVARLRPERNLTAHGRIYTINFTASQPQGGSCQNSVRVCVPLLPGGECIDPTPLFDSTKKPEIDLSMSMTDSPDPVNRGDGVTYTVTMTNSSSLLATHVNLFDDLPFHDYIEVVSSSLTCQHDTSANSLSCSVGTLAAGESRTATIVLRALVGGVLTNRVTVSSLDSTDPAFTNNRATATTGVNLMDDADLVVAIFDNPDPVIRGGPVTYTVTVLNRGPAVATGVTLTDLLPPLEINDSDVVVSQGTFTRQPRDGTIICNFGSLASNASATLTFTGFTFTSGSISNTATVRANELDLDTTNNSVTEFTTVNLQ